MLKNICIVGAILLCIVTGASAQQKMNPGGMTYLFGAKPNVIIYHDSVFNGVKQFRPLFYRKYDSELIGYAERHQSNKIAGQILGVVGTIATVVGIGQLSDDHKGLGWGLIGGGFVSTLAGGYFLLMGQKNLAMAVTLFNQRYSQASLGIGVSQNRAGLVYKF